MKKPKKSLVNVVIFLFFFYIMKRFKKRPHNIKKKKKKIFPKKQKTPFAILLFMKIRKQSNFKISISSLL